VRLCEVGSVTIGAVGLLRLLWSAHRRPLLLGRRIDPFPRNSRVDAYVQKVVKDWNVPGLGIGIVVKDKVVFGRATASETTGRSSPSRRRPTSPSPRTRTVYAPGDRLLVEEASSTESRYDSSCLPSSSQRRAQRHGYDQGYALAPHRITRHDAIWYKSTSLARSCRAAQVPRASQPLRQTFLYNNMM